MFLNVYSVELLGVNHGVLLVAMCCLELLVVALCSCVLLCVAVCCFNLWSHALLCFASSCFV